MQKIERESNLLKHKLVRVYGDKLVLSLVTEAPGLFGKVPNLVGKGRRNIVVAELGRRSKIL